MTDRATFARQWLSISGIVLFVYVTTHLLNHALGLVSLPTQEAGRHVFLALWRNPAGTALLYGSMLIHMALALWSLYRRRTLRMRRWEAAQLILGLLIPPLLCIHVFATRGAHELFGTDDTYFYVQFVYREEPKHGIRQAVTLLLAWLHGCIGIHFWLRVKPWYQHAAMAMYTGALLVPVLALLGVSHAISEVATISADPQRLENALAAIRPSSNDELDLFFTAEDRFLVGYLAAILGILGARSLRSTFELRRGTVRVTYPGGRVVSMPVGLTVLEMSRAAGIPHAAVCGGRGRCSTCRVRINAGLQTIPVASAEERKVLERIHAAERVRLACQVRPTGDLDITPLLPPTATPRDGFWRPSHLAGREQEIAILFADLRSFTHFAETKLPYDVVFVLNRYFEAMGRAIERAGGKVDKFIGDGVMALFGIDRGPEAGCRDALAAARAMFAALQELNHALVHDLEEPLRVGIGIHAGPAIIGEMGYGSTKSVTAIGDAVNTASRLEALTKTYDAQVVVSDVVVTRAGLVLDGLDSCNVEIRGRREPLKLWIVPEVSALPAVSVR